MARVSCAGFYFEIVFFSILRDYVLLDIFVEFSYGTCALLTSRRHVLDNVTVLGLF